MVMPEDPITGAYPGRTQDLEEDEAAAQAVADQYSAKPTIEWLLGEAPTVTTLVLLLGQGPALLAPTLFKAARPFGSITVPELQRLRSPLEEEYGRAPHRTHTSAVAVTDGGLAVVASPRLLPAEQAVAWADALLPALKLQTVVVVASLPASEYRGPGNAADEDLIFCLATSAAARPAAGVPQLPPGSLIGGVAAAVMQRCELSKQSATALVAVEAAPVPDASLVCSIAAAVSKALPAAAAAGLPSGRSLHSEVAAAVDAAYRSSASESMFI